MRNLAYHTYVTQEVKRIGRWNSDAYSISYLEDFSPQGLLAAGGWPSASKDDFKLFWAERYEVAVPEGLIMKIFPNLPALEEVTSLLYACLLGTPPLETLSPNELRTFGLVNYAHCTQDHDD